MTYPWTTGGGTTTPGTPITPTTGAEFLSGLGPPPSDLGKTGDTYVDYAPGAGTVYKRTNSGWAATPGTAAGAPGAPGADGAAGAPGMNGAPGVGISSSAIDGTGHLILTYSNGITQDVGLVKGADGVGGTGAAYKSDGTAPTTINVTSTTTPNSITTSAPAVLIYVSGGDVYVAFDGTTPTSSSTRWQAGETREVSVNTDILNLRFVKATGTPVLTVQTEVAA